MTTQQTELLQRLASAMGLDSEGVDTDQGRWRLYEQAISAGEQWERLEEAVRHERDGALATSVVLRMLELLPESRHGEWLRLLPPKNARYAEQRSKDIQTLRRAQRSELSAEDVAASVDDWTDWLQTRLVNGLDDRQALRVLSERGRTKRIRRAAAERNEKL